MSATTPQATPQVAYADLLPRGTVVYLHFRGVAGRYMGNAGSRWHGMKHRVRLADGRNRYVTAGELSRPGGWQHVSGYLWQFEYTEVTL